MSHTLSKQRQRNANRTRQSSRRQIARLNLSRLEDRTAPAVANLLAVGAGVGGGPHVKLLNADTGALVSEFMPYDAAFTGGVRVAMADVTGDGVPDVVTGPGPGGGPDVRVFDGVTGQRVRQFMAFDSAFRGGVTLAAADLNGDGKAEIIVAPDVGGGAVIRVFDGATGAMSTQFIAYNSNFRGGASIAVGDVTGDGVPDIISGPGPGGGPHVKVFDGSKLQMPTVVREFFAYDTAFAGGIFVAVAARTDSSNPAGLIVTGANAGGGPHIKSFDVTGDAPITVGSFNAFPWTFTGGVRVTALGATGNIAIAAGVDNSEAVAIGPRVVITNTLGGLVHSDVVYDSKFRGGVFAGGPPAPTLVGLPAVEGSPGQVSFRNLAGAAFTYSFDFDNDGVFEITNSTSPTATVPASYLADGPSTRQVRGQTRDASGATRDYFTKISIANAPPTVQLTGSFNVGLGGALNVTANVNDPSPVDVAAGFTYRWDFGDGSPISTTAAPSHVYTAVGSYTLRLTVTDKDGASADVTAPITVTPANLQATFTGDAAIEGSPGQVRFANPSGGSGGYRFSYDFNNDGIFEITDSSSMTATVPAGFLADGPATRVVRGRLKDSAGAFADFTTAISIANAPPTVQLSSSFTGSPGVGINFSATASDPSPIDLAAGLTYTWNFGDGTSPSNSPSPNHVYAVAGVYTVTVTVRDKDGGAASATSTVTVGTAASSFITTPYDRIPNFGANPTITATRSGSWSDAGTWSLGRLPGAADIVSIGTNITITYDIMSDVPVNTVAIQAGGSLVFRTDINTRLTVVNVLVMPGGTLQIGTAANPVAANVKAEIIIADQPFDYVLDPEQYGHGLIALGTVTMHGAAKNETFVRLAVEPLAGATTLTLATPVTGWQVGDKVVLPDSRQYALESNQQYTQQYEEATIAAISADGRTITLAAPLQFNHPGAHDGNGTLTFLPHVANRTRNVVLKSASSFGTRGHVYFTYRAAIDVRYVQFGGLGRTTFNLIDNTTFNTSGAVTHVGTNQDQRFPIHFAHLYGPTTTPANGYQYTFVGNVVQCLMPDNPFKWGITINDSHYGLIQDNFVYNWAGSGVVTMAGNESFNVIARNFVVRGFGHGDRLGGMGGPNPNGGAEGVGFWFRGVNNYVRDNVASTYTNNDSRESAYGFKYMMYYLGNIRVPIAKGADLSVAGQYTVRNGNAMPLLEFSGNETYGIHNALTFWWLNSVDTAPQNGGRSTVSNFRGWHIHSYGFYGYPMNDVVFDGFTLHNEKSVLSNSAEWVIGLWFGDYLAQKVVIRNADIQGFRTGFVDPFFGGSTTVLENSYLRNSTNIAVRSIGAPGSAPVGSWHEAKSLIIRNVRFGDASQWNLGGLQPANIVMDYTDHNGTANLIASDTVFVYDYNGVAGDNFQIFYNEQRPDFIVPQSTSNLVGAPVAGLTNQQAWNQYGIAIAGSVASNTTTRALIRGLLRSTP